jgi:predicted TIM-barrel fold metal-dependent hydrolase
MTVTNESPRHSDVLGDVKIVDCDAHFTEPPDLWSSRAPASMKDRVPVMRTVDGVTNWFHHDEVWASIGGNTIATGGNKVLGSHVVQPFDAVDVGAWSVKERLELMDRMGIHAQVVYPNGIGFASNHLFAIEDEVERTAILELYNDFLVDVQAESQGRILPQAVLPIWDMELTVREMTRLIDRGITGFTLSDKPELLGLPELDEPFFDPMWDLFGESGTVTNFHIGSGFRREDQESIRRTGNLPGVGGPGEIPLVAAPTWQSLGRQRKLATMATQFYMSNVRIIANLCMSDLFDRFPKVKVVSAESGIGWVPFVLEALEFQFDEMVTLDEEINKTKMRPREYFNEHLYVMFWFEETGAMKLIEDVGVHNVLVETDVPHPTCLFPEPRTQYAKVLAGIDPYIQRRVLQDNAAELYGIDLST